MLEVRLSTWRLSPSSASAWQPRSGIQKSRAEARAQIGGAPLEPVGERGVVPHLAGQARGAPLARRRRSPGSRRSRSVRRASVPSANWIEFQLSFQHWLTSPVTRVAAFVLDVAVAVEVPAVLDPGQRRTGVGLELADEPVVAGPAVVLVEQDEEQRRRVGGPEVRRVRSLAQRRQLAEAQLVQDLARLLLVEVVARLRLAGGEQRAAWWRRARAGTAAPGSW